MVNVQFRERADLPKSSVGDHTQMGAVRCGAVRGDRSKRSSVVCGSATGDAPDVPVMSPFEGF